MLECIKFGDCKIKTIQIEDEWFVSVRHTSIILGVRSVALKGIVRNHLPAQYKFSKKEINIDDPYDGSKLFTTIPGACGVILGSTHPDLIDMMLTIFLLRDIIYRIRLGKHKKQGMWHLMIVYLHPSIIENTSIFVFKLAEPALLGSKKITYEYARISRYPWHMKNGIKNFREKHPGSIIILKMVNDPLRVWKKNHNITVFRCYFCINKAHDHILLIDDKKFTKAT